MDVTDVMDSEEGSGNIIWDACHDDQRSTALVFYPILMPIQNFIWTFGATPVLFFFIQAYRQGKIKSAKVWFVVHIVFFFVSWTYFVFGIPSWFMACSNLDALSFGLNLGSQQYGIATLFFVFMLAWRLHRIFKDTTFALSKVTVGIFGTLFVIASLLVIGAAGLQANAQSEDLRGLLISLAFLLVIIMIIWLDGCFVYKLVSVHRLSAKATTDTRFISLVTKNFILAISGTSVLFLSGIMSTLYPIVDSVPFTFFAITISAFDIFTNIYATFLSWKHFDPWYQKVCGCCHERCLGCWYKCITPKEDRAPVRVDSGGEEGPKTPDDQQSIAEATQASSRNITAVGSSAIGSETDTHAE